jgi:hypothetical protein
MKSAANQRAKKVDDLMKRYNELVDKLPQDQPLPQKLKKDDFKLLGMGDKLWEIDLLRGEQPWAFKPSIRKGIDTLHLADRAREEATMVGEEAQRFVDWIRDRLYQIQHLLCTMNSANSNTFCYQRLLQVGLKTAQTLNQMTDIQNLGKGLENNSTKAIKDAIQMFKSMFNHSNGKLRLQMQPSQQRNVWSDGTKPSRS